MANKKEAHQCHFCGDWVTDGIGVDGERHWLSDCRPDLVEHEPGPLCTWPYEIPPHSCYAYINFDTKKTETEHIHFHKDGPM